MAMAESKKSKRKQALELLQMPPPASLSRHSLSPEEEWDERKDVWREARAYTHPSGKAEVAEGAFPYSGKELVEAAKKAEKFEPSVYKDSSNLDTVGYGHLVTAGEKFDKPLTEKQATALLEKDMETRGRAPALRIFPGLEDAPENVQGTLANMVFNGMMTTKAKGEDKSPLDKAWSEYRSSGNVNDIIKYMDEEFDSGKFARGNEKRLLRYKKALKESK